MEVRTSITEIRERFRGECVLNRRTEVHQGHEITRLVVQIAQMHTYIDSTHTPEEGTCNPKRKQFPPQYGPICCFA